MATRLPAVAGQFYPKDPAALHDMIAELMKNSKRATVAGIKAMIVPHAGYTFSGIVAASGYSTIKGKDYERVILLGPSHRVRFEGGAFDANDKWRTPLGEVDIDRFDSFKIRTSSQAHNWEHSLEVQVPFLQETLGHFMLIPISLGSSLDDEELLKAMDDKTLLIVSSDLSHYMPYDYAKKTDAKTIEKILTLNPSVKHDEACGADGINALIRLAKRQGWKPSLLDYRNSGDTAGDKTGVVGYACIAFT